MRRQSALFGPRRRVGRSVESTIFAFVVIVALFLFVVENYWPVLLAGGFICASLMFWQTRERERRIRALGIAEIDYMTGPQFEVYLERLLTFHGYSVKQTGRSGDEGCDLVLVRDGSRIVCQAKRYNKPVTNRAVQEAVAAKALYHCDGAMVVTNSRFTPGAHKLAAANGCSLVDRDELGRLVVVFQRRPEVAQGAKSSG